MRRSTVDFHRAWPRIGLSVVLGLFAAFLLPLPESLDSVAAHVVIGWDVGATVLLALHLRLIMYSNADQARSRASAEDPHKRGVMVVVLLASSVVVVTCLAIVRKESSAADLWLLQALCLYAALSAWCVTQTTFALRYAHLYYRHKDDVGGLDFPGSQQPDDWDFAYFAFTLGMCFQVSDVTISRRSIRRTALLHAVVSFFYNTAILALALNVIFGRL